MTDKRIVLTTTGSREEGEKIARALVERRLAACVNLVGPIASVYRWQEKVEQAAEFLLLIKTTADCFPDVREAIEEMHSYELPECVALPIEAGSAEYLDWIGDAVE
ncbi:MAG TPA: divalent-cation tolerance protein CutA [Terriglobales bacterium]|nr:divalent-cation tolerance protein CutA [Terriglobales bacterium]